MYRQFLEIALLPGKQARGSQRIFGSLFVHERCRPCTKRHYDCEKVTRNIVVEDFNMSNAPMKGLASGPIVPGGVLPHSSRPQNGLHTDLRMPYAGGCWMWCEERGSL